MMVWAVADLLRHIGEFGRGVADHSVWACASTSSIERTIRREMCGILFEECSPCWRRAGGEADVLS